MPRETPDQPNLPSLATQAMRPRSKFPSGLLFPSEQPVELESEKFDTQNLLIQSEPPDPQSARSHFLHSLLDSPRVLERILPLFTEEQRRVSVMISFEAAENPIAEDYAIFFDTLGRLNRLFLCVTRFRHFTRTWLAEAPIELSPFEHFEITGITKNSPGKLEGSALAEVTHSLSEALSLGDQITKIRLSGIKVRDARIEVEKKELELEELKRVAYQQPTVIDVQIAKQRKLAELEERSYGGKKMRQPGNAGNSLWKTWHSRSSFLGKAFPC